MSVVEAPSMYVPALDAPTHVYEKFPFKGAFGFYESAYLRNVHEQDRASFDELMKFFKSFPGNTSVSGSHAIDDLVKVNKITL